MNRWHFVSYTLANNSHTPSDLYMSKNDKRGVTIMHRQKNWVYSFRFLPLYFRWMVNGPKLLQSTQLTKQFKESVEMGSAGITESKVLHFQKRTQKGLNFPKPPSIPFPSHIKCNTFFFFSVLISVCWRYAIYMRACTFIFFISAIIILHKFGWIYGLYIQIKLIHKINDPIRGAHEWCIADFEIDATQYMCVAEKYVAVFCHILFIDRRLQYLFIKCAVFRYTLCAQRLKLRRYIQAISIQIEKTDYSFCCVNLFDFLVNQCYTHWLFYAQISSIDITPIDTNYNNILKRSPAVCRATMKWPMAYAKHSGIVSDHSSKVVAEIVLFCTCFRKNF